MISARIDVSRSALVLLLSASVYVATAPGSEAAHPKNKPEGSFMADIEQTIVKFREGSSCDPNTYKLLQEMLQFEEGASEAHLEFEESRGHVRAIDIERIQGVATIYNELASAAYDKRCFDLARANYLHVIETYIGSDYAAMRQRAQIGLDDIRAVSTVHGAPATLLGVHKEP